MNIINWTLYLKFQSYTMKTIQLALLGMGLIFFNLKTLLFQSSFRITEELHRKYKEIWYIQFVHSPHLQIPFSL